VRDFKNAGTVPLMIIALAGRRVDAIDAQQQQFSPSRESVKMVRERIRALLQTQCATVLVSSAACGADLLALSEASNLGLRRRIILPFDREKFRATSVTDRPGDWGLLYNTVLNEVEANGDILIIQPDSEDNAYAEVNHVIVDEAISLGLELHQPVTAVLVWNGKSRGEGDITEEFGAYACKRGVPVIDIMTL
jgi:hypothetical protein